MRAASGRTRGAIVGGCEREASRRIHAYVPEDGVREAALQAAALRADLIDNGADVALR